MAYNVAIVGATGNVGREMLTILEELEFPVAEMHAVASRKSKGVEVAWKDKTIKCEVIDTFDFSKVKSCAKESKILRSAIIVQS